MPVQDSVVAIPSVTVTTGICRQAKAPRASRYACAARSRRQCGLRSKIRSSNPSTQAGYAKSLESDSAADGPAPAARPSRARGPASRKRGRMTHSGYSADPSSGRVRPMRRSTSTVDSSAPSTACRGRRVRVGTGGRRDLRVRPDTCGYPLVLAIPGPVGKSTGRLDTRSV
jgi:hypothetical protein